MKLGEIKQFNLVNIMESTTNGSAVILESAAEMVRSIRTKVNAGEEPSVLGDFWTVDNLVKFCAGLERIDDFITKATSAKKLDTNTRDAAFSVVMTADFDDATVVQKIIKQSTNQPALISKWQSALEDKAKAVPALDKLARDISAMAGLLRTNGAQSIAPKHAEPTAGAAEPVL